MFSRKKPPQLTILEELQNAYDECCNLSVHNLTLEEENKLDSALKGWKSLHTSMLYRTDIFDRLLLKMDEQERGILQELKNIRDQNVKHLIRVQMRMDEAERRRPSINPQGLSTNGANVNGSSMSVPSLRSTGHPGSSRSFSSSTQTRLMLKSLRPQAASGSSNKKSMESAAKAASVSWRQPEKKQPSARNSHPSGGTSNSGMFADFDQDWEKVRSRLPTPDLIDLDDGIHGLGLSDGFTRSMEDVSSNRQPPPPPPPRASKNLPVPQLKPKIPQASKSTPDIRSNGSSNGNGNGNGNAEPKKYVYNQPKPMNVNGMIRAQAKKKAAAAASASTSTPTTTHASTLTTAKKVVRKPNTSSQATNVAYKSTTIPKIYVKKPNPSGGAKKPTAIKKVVSAPPEINSPTMDDILGGYDEHGIEVDDRELIVSTDQKSEGMSDSQENLLIKSIRGIDFDSAKQILNDIVIHGDEVHWTDIAGLESAKNSLKEAVVYPFLRPDLFSGLREPARGLLLFGPPGTGKTMLARAVATESKSTFFSISASSLTSKYLGESEKLVKALFLLARKLSPSIVFVDEIDSLLSTRTDGEVDSLRRIKNEFLIQWSELSSAAAGKDPSGNNNVDGDVSRVLILGATNVPWAIDEAARRRFVRRQYIPLPEDETRKVHLNHLLSHQKHTLNDEDFDELVKLTQGFSGSDITALAKDAAMGPLRSLGDLILATPRDQIRPVSLEDFKASLLYIRPSVLAEGLGQHEEWAALYGSYGG